MLIRRAELLDGRVVDVRLEEGMIVAMGALAAHPGEALLDAAGGLLLPGLHDHHIHVAALAASLSSVRCGPPDIVDASGLEETLRAAPGTEWLRGTGYHESVAGLLDARMIDDFVADRPIRIQHRSGRMWFLNSEGLARILEGRDAPPGLEREHGRFTGRLFEGDAWLRTVLAASPPSFAAVGAMLARLGVTGVTEISPANDAVIARHFAREMARGALPQRVLLAGSLGLKIADVAPRLTLGPAKLHLHEARLAALDEAARFVAAAHAQGRVVAVHCATEVELLYTLALFDEAGIAAGDRIEHASVTPDFALDEIARRGLAVVTQPHFIAERGDSYRRDVETDVQPLLYRLRAFTAAGVTLAGGSDAPFGNADPWAAMAAAVSRTTRGGAVIGADEALTPEQALDLYLCDPVALDRRREVGVGAVADLCLLHRPWREARTSLSSRDVRAVFVDGRRIDDRIDQPPA